MPIETIGNFSVRKIAIMDEYENVDESLMPRLSDKDIDLIYQHMLLSRMLDDKLVKMQRQGRLGNLPTCTGQEAASLGVAFAIKKSDWLFPAYRENPALFFHGLPIKNILLYWMGHEAGNIVPENVNCYMMCLPIATHIPISAGFALGNKIKNKDSIVVSFFGDGATSEGDFHESLNFAGVFKLPIIFVCQNNQWAISTPINKQTASQSIAQKAIAYGIEGMQVDGNDIFSVIYASKIAVENARKFQPTLIECITYRQGAHTTADDPLRYISKEEHEIGKSKDPILRLKKYMQKKRIWNEDYESNVVKECEDKIKQAVDDAEKHKENPSEIFTHVYSEIPRLLEEQMKKIHPRRK